MSMPFHRAGLRERLQPKIRCLEILKRTLLCGLADLTEKQPSMEIRDTQIISMGSQLSLLGSGGRGEKPSKDVAEILLPMLLLLLLLPYFLSCS